MIVLVVISITLSFVMLTSFLSAELLTSFKIPKLISKHKTADVCLSPRHMLNAWYNIERLEPFCEELKIDKKVSERNMKYHQFFDINDDENPNRFSNHGLTVIIDSINELTVVKKPIWASYLFHRTFDNNKTILQDDTLIQEVKSFPIYIANTSQNKTALIETQDGSMMMILEAQDEHKQWKPIEYWSHSWCGNSYFSVEIPPQHFLMTRGIKCSGDFYTLCRLKVLNKNDSIYSNEFKMSINLSQFNKPESVRER